MIAEPLSYMGPIFLFHMSVIIFVVSSRAGKDNGLFSVSKMSNKVIVQEF